MKNHEINLQKMFQGWKHCNNIKLVSAYLLKYKTALTMVNYWPFSKELLGPPVELEILPAIYQAGSNHTWHEDVIFSQCKVLLNVHQTGSGPVTHNETQLDEFCQSQPDSSTISWREFQILFALTVKKPLRLFNLNQLSFNLKSCPSIRVVDYSLHKAALTLVENRPLPEEPTNPRPV